LAYNCSIHHWGWYVPVYTSSVHLAGVGNTISHCVFHSSPHSGLILGGNDHLIEYSEFHHIGLVSTVCVVSVLSRPLRLGYLTRTYYSLGLC
jgi:hypothetical protein